MKTTTALIALMGLATVGEAQEIRPQSGAQFLPLRIFDATGKFMGGTVPEPDVSGAPATALLVTFRYYSPIGARKGDTFTLRIQVDTSGSHIRYRWSQVHPGDVFIFESTDCTGQPYQWAENPSLAPGRRLALLDTEFNLLYLSEPDPLIVTKTMHSYRYPLEACQESLTDDIRVVAIEPVIDMDTVFTLPFQVR